MEFKDFASNPKELIGKWVIYESGFGYSENRSKTLHKIESVTKTGFRLSSKPDVLFSLIDGCRKGLGGRMNMGVISKCRLVTDEEADQIREQWRQVKEERALREKMEEKVKTMSFEQLKKMELL